MSKQLSIVGVTEIANMLDMTRQGAAQLIERTDNFPEPLGRIAAGPVWRESDIKRWIKDRQEGRK